MTQHDKIWILNKSQEFALRDKDGYSPGCIEGPVICATIEELRDFCFETAFNTANPQGSNGDVGDFRKSFVAAFKSTLTSKGIHIP